MTPSLRPTSGPPPVPGPPPEVPLPGPAPGPEAAPGWETGSLVVLVLLVALAVVVWLWRARRPRHATPTPTTTALAGPAWRDVDYHSGPTPTDPSEVADRRTLVGWCIDVADRLQDREPALAARLRRGLAEAGVEAYEPDGERFDATRFDAVESEVTAAVEHDRTVASTRLLGYVDRGVVLRRPEVVVYRLGTADDVR